MIPNTPQPGTGLADPLISPDDYATFTGDGDTDSATIEQSVTAALDMVQRKCNRTLGYGQYREELFLYANGMVFPGAPPIDHSKPISSGITDTTTAIYDPTTDNQPGEGSIIQGAGVWVGWFTPLPWMPVWTGIIPPQTFVTYWGGYNPYGATDGSTPGLPFELAHAIASLVFFMTHPVALAGMPRGVKSMSVGGVSISGDLSSFMLMDPQLRKTLRAFTRPQARHWES